LSVRELDDGRVLVHDFGGCETGDVLAAISLSLVDLFPDRIDHRVAPVRPNHWHAAREALRSLKFEILLVAVAGENLHEGLSLDDQDRARLWEAVHRIHRVAELVT
jgi:hypothetical protein